MKVLQVNKFFWNKGGSETYYFGLTKLLQTAGHEVIPFSMQDTRNKPTPYSQFFVPHIDFQAPGNALKKSAHFLYSTQAKKQLELLILQEQPEIAHVHNIAHQLTPAIFSVLKKHQIPVVQTLHDYQLICPNYKLYTQGSACERCFKHKYYNAARFKCLNDSFPGGLLGAMEMTLHKLILRSYDHVDIFVCPSQFLFDRLVAWGIPQYKLRYIPNFVEPVSHSPAQTTVSSKEFLFIGRLTKEKGIDIFLQAAGGLPDIQFGVIGEAETPERTETYKKQVEALPNVRWYGRVEEQKVVREKMAQARAVVVPSEWYENAPMTVLEAQSVGTWVIGSNHGGLPELIQDGKNGMVFTPGSVEELKKCIVETSALPKVITQLDQKFTPMYHLEQIQQVYQSLVT